jgi:hypothetical protein
VGRVALLPVAVGMRRQRKVLGHRSAEGAGRPARPFGVFRVPWCSRQRGMYVTEYAGDFAIATSERFAAVEVQ